MQLNQKKSEEKQETVEHRDAFRVNDNILLSMKPIPVYEVDKTLAEFPEKYEQIKLMNQFTDASNAVIDQFALVRRRHPEVAKYLELLDNKINALSKREFSTLSSVSNLQLKEVNISAGGLRFLHTEQISKGSFLELTIKLSTSSHCLLIYGEVLRCESINNSDNPFEVACKFIQIDHDDREIIHSHIRHLEMKLIRKKSVK